jgi:hypothetical protein
LVFDRMREDFEASSYNAIKRAVASSLGMRYQPDKSIDFFVLHYAKGKFRGCLRALETICEALEGVAVQAQISEEISSILRESEVDLGIDWQPPVFIRTGARLLDERLVNASLHWLSDPQYQTVYDPFEKGLSYFLEERLADAVTDMYEAIKALAKIVTGRDRDLSANREMFINRVRASDYSQQMLRDYFLFANQYRHAAQQNRPRPQLSEPEVESFIYLTGLFIRLAIRTT